MQALIWSKMSTGLPIDISSSMKGQNYNSFCRLDIDIHRYELNMGQSWISYPLGPQVCTVYTIYLHQGSLMILILAVKKYSLSSLLTIIRSFFQLSGTYLMFIIMKNGIARIGGTVLKSKLLLREIGQLTVYVLDQLLLSCWFLLVSLMSFLIKFVQVS